MNRILVIGSSGAGKSTFAKELAKRTGIPLYHLDLIWFHDNGDIESIKIFNFIDFPGIKEFFSLFYTLFVFLMLIHDKFSKVAWQSKKGRDFRFEIPSFRFHCFMMINPRLLLGCRQFGLVNQSLM